MNCAIEEMIPAPPPPPEASYNTDHSDRSLTAYYITNNEDHEIDCFFSPCRTRCHFSNDEFGEVIFDHKTEKFLASTKFIDNDYLTYLTRVIRQWKKQFPDF